MTHTPICHLPLVGRMGGGYNMKKYIKPCIEQLKAECVQIIAVSIIDGVQANDSEVLTKENNDWAIWEDD